MQRHIDLVFCADLKSDSAGSGISDLNIVLTFAAAWEDGISVP